MLKARYRPSGGNRYVTARLHIRKIVKFLLEHPSARTTADLTGALIGDYAARSGDLDEKNRNVALTYLRRAFNLAVEWGCLKRNPFDGYPLPKRLPPPIEAESGGEKLEADRVRGLLAHLKSSAVTWNDNRFFILVSMTAHTGLLPSELLGRTVLDCHDGMIRRKQGKWARRKPVPIGPDLKKDLDAWMLIRKLREQDRRGDPPYGKKLAGDGKTLIPDEAIQALINEMHRWRGGEKKRSFQQIADELNARGIPTKRGKGKWQHSSVRKILARTRKIDSDERVVAGEDRAEDVGGPEWIFPNASGNGHWSGGTGTGRTALEKLRNAGEKVGIEGLTFVSLARSHLLDIRTGPDVDMGSDVPSLTAAGPTSAPRDSATGRQKSIDRKAGPCPVELRGAGVPIRVYGVEIPRMTGIAYDLTEFAVERYLEGDFCGGFELAGRTTTTCSNPIKSLKVKLKEPGFEPLARVLIWDGTRGGSLRIIDPGQV